MKRKPTDKPWVEKYRPISMDQVAHQDEVVAVLKKSFTNQDFPNLLFYGPPGTGKTSTILAMARDLFGEMYKDRLLELNASDERGINVVRTKVKNFSHLSVHATTTSKGVVCPALKMVVLDEADSMTTAAQAALRRIMEKESRTTRFCLICNYVSRIIEPIASRCAKFRFKPLPNDVMRKRLKEIAEKEEVTVDDEALTTLITISDGDLRKAITTLQTTARVAGDEPVENEVMLDIAGVIPDAVVDGLVDACKSGSYEQVGTVVKNFLLDGYPLLQFLFQIIDKLVCDDQLSDTAKATVCTKISEVDKCLLDGADEYLQFMNLSSHLLKAYQQA